MSSLSLDQQITAARLSRIQRLLQWGIFPALLGLSALAAAASYSHRIDPMAAQMATFAASLLAVLLVQRVLPFDRRWQTSTKEDRRVDLTSWIALMTVFDPLLKRGLFPLLMSWTVTLQHPHGGLDLFPGDLPIVVQVALALIIAEFGQYWMHRFAHRQGWLWRVHTMHHVPTRISLLNGFRVNPLNMFWHQLSGLFVLMLIGTPAAIIHCVILLSTVIGVFQHANADLRFDGWNWVLGTADLHRWHHSTKASEAQCNFGQNIMLWDQLFGTYRRATPLAPAAVGIEGAVPSARGYLGWVLRSSLGR